MKAAFAAIKLLKTDPFARIDGEKDRFLDAVLGILIIFTAVNVLAGILIPSMGESFSLNHFMADLAFFLYFTIMYFICRNGKTGMLAGRLMFPVYLFFCFFPITEHSGEPSALFWVFTIPFIALRVLGVKPGLIFSIVLFPFVVFPIRFTGMYSILHISGVYALVLALSFYLWKHFTMERKIDPQVKSDLSCLAPREEKLQSLQEALDRTFDDNSDFYLFYRKNILETLLTIPNPDSVLSYILLEGISNVALFNPDSSDSDFDTSDTGRYMVASGSIENYFSKVESVIKLRKAKKSLEFNKIQAQMNRLLNDEQPKEDLYGQFGVSDREIEIANCILKGMSNKEISQELYISVETVKTHVKNILKKCGVSNRIELVRLFTGSHGEI